jgi:hypothetical protein
VLNRWCRVEKETSLEFIFVAVIKVGAWIDVNVDVDDMRMENRPFVPKCQTRRHAQVCNSPCKLEE